MLGLRGPVLDSFAVVITIRLHEGLAIRSYEISLLDLGGLAVRDLARIDKDILLVAGPVSDAPGAFRLYRWQPKSTNAIQRPTLLFTWPESEEKPEGICPLRRDGEDGLLVVYDRPDAAKRIRNPVYLADWLTGV